MERVYPKLKSYCQSIGYDFQVVDMRWGIRDEATDDHMTTQLCMNELKACQDMSTGPNFIVSILILHNRKSDIRLTIGSPANLMQLQPLIFSRKCKLLKLAQYVSVVAKERPSLIAQPNCTAKHSQIAQPLCSFCSRLCSNCCR